MADETLGALDLRLLSNFVHQVINPLNGVIGTIDNIIDGTVQKERREQRLRVVRAQLEWTVLLIRNLAYFTGTSLTPGTSSAPKTENCIVPELVIEAAQFFQEIAATQHIKVLLTDERTQYVVEGSRDLLRQLFMNLIDNAVKYAEPSSVVEIKPWVQKKTSSLIIEVSNEGVGFKAHEAEKLFEIGFRSDEAKNRIASGTGLGLFICRRIVEDVFAGSISAEHSTKLRRTTFRVRFPKWRLA